MIHELYASFSSPFYNVLWERERERASCFHWGRDIRRLFSFLLFVYRFPHLNFLPSPCWLTFGEGKVNDDDDQEKREKRKIICNDSSILSPKTIIHCLQIFIHWTVWDWTTFLTQDSGRNSHNPFHSQHKRWWWESEWVHDHRKERWITQTKGEKTDALGQKGAFLLVVSGVW